MNITIKSYKNYTSTDLLSHMYIVTNPFAVPCWSCIFAFRVVDNSYIVREIVMGQSYFGRQPLSWIIHLRGL